MTQPGSACIPVMDPAHLRRAIDCCERVMQMSREDVKPSNIKTRVLHKQCSAA
jgi:dihydroxyacid dehydratase/phosphogluconate dehydratase